MDSVDHHKSVPDHSILEGHDKVSKHSMPSKTPEIDEKISQLTFGIMEANEPGQVVADLSDSNVELLGDFDFMMDDVEGEESLITEQIASDVDVLAEKLLMTSGKMFVNETTTVDFGINLQDQFIVSEQDEQQVTKGLEQLFGVFAKLESISEVNQHVAFLELSNTGKMTQVSCKEINVSSSELVIYNKKDNIAYVQQKPNAVQRKSIQNKFGNNVRIVVVPQHTWKNFLGALQERLIQLLEKENRQQKEEQSAVAKHSAPSSEKLKVQVRDRNRRNEEELNKPITHIKRKVAMSFLEDEIRAHEKKRKGEKEAAEKARDIERQEVKKQERKTEIIKEEIKKKNR